MNQLKTASSYAGIEPLFNSLGYHLSLASSFHGLTPAEVYVDRLARPSAALMRAGHHYTLVGNPRARAFVADLREWFAGEVYPALRAAHGWGFQLFYSAGWERVIEEDILQSYRPILAQRQYYEINLRETPPPSAGPLPAGFELRPVTGALMQDASLAGLDELAEEMCSERPSVEDFLSRSFGLCLIHDNRVAGWCLSEYNLGTRCEVGIAVDEAHRQHGLATRMGVAFCEQAVKTGMERIGWHCWTRNLPSAATALKIGLRKVADYDTFFCLAEPPAQE